MNESEEKVSAAKKIKKFTRHLFRERSSCKEIFFFLIFND